MFKVILFAIMGFITMITVLFMVTSSYAKDPEEDKGRKIRAIYIEDPTDKMCKIVCLATGSSPMISLQSGNNDMGIVIHKSAMGFILRKGNETRIVDLWRMGKPLKNKPLLENTAQYDYTQ